MKNETIKNDNAGVITFTPPQTKIDIKTIDITAKEWFDKVNGNSYFSAHVVINWQLPGQTMFKIPFRYGYGDHYKEIAMQELLKRKLIPGHDSDAFRQALWRYCDDNKIILRCDKHEKCLKREVVAFGME